MKKFLIILITLAMCTAAFALAGCEDEKDTDSGTQTEQGGTEDGDQTEQGGGTEDGDPTNSGIVTQAEWEAAFDAKNFENYQFDGKSRPHGQESGISAILARVESSGTSVKMYIEQTYSGTKTVNYYEDTGDAAYKYDQEGDGWVRTVENYFTPDYLLTYSNFFANKFGSAVYDEENSCYTVADFTEGEGEGAQSYTACRIQFADKKLSVVNYSVQDHGSSYTMDVEIGYSNYGTTTVVLPAAEDVIDRTQSLSAQEWQAAFDESIFENIRYTQELTFGNTSLTSSYAIVYSEGTWRIKQDDALYYEVTPDGTYSYSLANGVWTKRPYDGGFRYDFCYFMLVRDMYDFFREYFDGNQNGYIADNVEVFFGGTTPELCEQVSILLNENRKISEVTYVMSEGRGTISCKIEYGNAEVTLPEDFVDETAPAQGMTETEWNAAFDESNFYNMTYTSSRSDAGDGYESYAENTIRVYTAGQSTIIYTSACLNGEFNNERYYECTDDGVFFLYTFSDGVWTKTQQNGDPLKGLCGEITAFQSMYGKLEYDSADHTHKGDGITSTELAIENAAVTISFADGKIAGFSVDTKDETSTMQIRGSIEYESQEIVLPSIEEQ